MNQKRGFGIWCSTALLVALTAAACGGGSQEQGDAAAARTGATSAASARGQDREAIVGRLRTELARLLKKDVEQLPVDKPVTELGADDLTVVEWQMAAERAFSIDIDDDKLFDTGTRTRPTLTIAAMAEVVATSPSSR